MTYKVVSIFYLQKINYMIKYICKINKRKEVKYMEKKYNIVLGLMVFFFIIIVGGALAWGLGYIGLKDSAGDENNTNIDTPIKEDVAIDNNIEKEDSTNDTESNKNESSLTRSEIEELNKKYVSLYLSAIAAGSPEGRVAAIMGYSSYQELESHYTETVVDEMYKVMDIEYSDFTSKLSALSKQLLDDVYIFKSDIQLFKEYNGKLAVHQGGWTGLGYEFVSQKLLSSTNDTYEWEVIVKRTGIDETSEELKCQVQGKVENNKYIIISFVGV